MTTLLLASGNPGKQHELRALLRALPLELRTPQEIDLHIRVEEIGETYAENARLKAQRYAEHSGLWTLADDSGLEVDALGGAPGMRSARIAGPARSDRDRRHLLLELLQPHPRPWTARFRCWVALVGPVGEVDSAEGICEGEIIPEERGTGGFGYDPIFLVQNSTLTMAELSMAQKNRISHRARAIHALMPTLKHKLKIT
jgi:XTP/dITP diphosphohydrolase